MDCYGYMREALTLARRAAEGGDVPVGAVIADNSTGEIIGRGFNEREAEGNALLHAEITAIGQACKKRGGWRLSDCTMYVTLEPCIMCAGAIINARIDTVVFAAFDPKAGAVDSVFRSFSLPLNHRPEFMGGILENEASELLSDFFKERRK